MYCWGDLQYVSNGGTALTSAYATPITTDGIVPLAGVIQADVSYAHACAIVQGASAKEVYCWGYNAYEELGLGDTTLRKFPVKVAGIAAPTRVSLARISTCVLDGGKVRCWGYNGYGAGGSGTTGGNIHGPTLVTYSGGATALDQLVDLRAAPDSFCALRADKSTWCWGQGFQNSASNYGVTNVVALGIADGPSFLTSDGVYHRGATLITPNCGVLE